MNSTRDIETADEGLFDSALLRSPVAALASDSVDDVLNVVLREPSKNRRATLWTLTIIFAAIVVAAGFVVWLWGYRDQQNNPGFWQVSLCSMLFWLSVTQGMVALGAVLRICHASWRHNLTRMLDIASLYGLWVIALLPFMVAARSQIYRLGAATDSDRVWRVAGSSFWDALAIGTAFAAGWMLLYLTSVPDFAVLAAKSFGGSKRQRLYSMLSKGWVGDSGQWRITRRVEGTLVIGVLISFVASQTVLGWDFQLASARDWDSSIFAPLFTLGSLLAGAAMMTLVGTVANRFTNSLVIMEARHYDNLGRITMGLGLIWFYFRWCDFLTAWYEHIPSEWRIEGNRVAAFPILAIAMTLGCFVIPVFCNMPSVARKSKVAQCLISVSVLIGIAIQRYLDTVPTFAPNYPVSALEPTVGSAFVFVGMAAMFVLTFLLAARYFPIASRWALVMERTRSGRRTMGNTTVTVMLDDPPVWET